MKFLLAVAFVLLVGLLCIEANDFNLASTLQGNWRVETTTILSKQNNEPLTRLATFSFGTSAPNSLKGNYTEESVADEGEIPAAPSVLHIAIESESPRSGNFKFLTIDSSKKKVEEEDIEVVEGDDSSFTAMLDFDYSFSVSSEGNGFFVSTGNYVDHSAKTSGVYQWTILSNQQFELTLVEYANEQYKLKRFIGKKIINAEPSFFQKYGTTILLVVFMFGRNFIKPPAQPAAAQGAPAAPAANAQ